MAEKFGWDASKGRYAAIPQPKRLEPPKTDWTKIGAYRPDLNSR